MTYTEIYKCNSCPSYWKHTWDTEDLNNDYTCCPLCGDTDYEELDDIQN